MSVLTDIALAGAPTAAAQGSVGDFFAQTAFSGSMFLAVPIALLAGLISFASPCVVPLVPGYIGFLGGLAGSQANAQFFAPQGTTAATQSKAKRAPKGATQGRVLLGMALFILGFTLVFTLTGVVTGAVGVALAQWSGTVTRVLGVLVILMGLAFMGALPLFQNEKRMHLAPKAGLWGAPILGFVFGLGWTPCLGPTLVAINSLALTEGSVARGAILAVVYSLGLGLPFLILAVGLERSHKALAFLRKHRVLIMRIGGGLLVLIGISLATGLWGHISGVLARWIGLTETVV